MIQLTITKFLVNAKRNSYAGGGEQQEKKLPDGGKEFFYKESCFQYRDRYYGFNPFAGEEVVWEKGKAIWIMNYYGRVLSTTPSAKTVYAFLRRALQKVQEERPFRGASMFRKGDFEYRDESTGNVEEFTGTETILYRGKEAYRLWYHGGRI